MLVAFFLGTKGTKEKERKDFMKKKILAVLLAATMTLSMIACGGEEESEPTETATTETSEDGESSELDAIGDIEVEENLFSVELTIPADYVGETTQEELDQIAEENGYKSITLHEDGSATYVMKKSQHEEMMEGIADEINLGLEEMVNSEDYNFTAIEANSDFTEITVTTTSTELNMSESFAVMVIYMYGGMYHVFNGTTVDNIHVDFVNADTGEVIESADSSEME